MLENPVTMKEFKMPKKKEHHKKEHHMENDKQSKLGMVMPLAHGKGAQHLKPMKDHKAGRGK